MTRIGRQRGMSLTTGFDVEFDLDVETFSMPTVGHGIDNSGVEMAIKFMKKNYN